MTASNEEVQRTIEGYLEQLRRRLRPLSGEHRREIVEELRGHIEDKLAAGGSTASSVEATLAALGTPEELASQYVTYELMARAEVTRSPLHILESLFRWGTLSFVGFFVLIAVLTGYFVGAALFLSAVLKPFHPHSAGLWAFVDGAGSAVVSLRLGFGDPPAGGHELLGWWIVPIGLLTGWGLVTLTTRLAVWCTQQYRRAHEL